MLNPPKKRATKPESIIGGLVSFPFAVAFVTLAVKVAVEIVDLVWGLW